jgi:hypothetical protein
MAQGSTLYADALQVHARGSSVLFGRVPSTWWTRCSILKGERVTPPTEQQIHGTAILDRPSLNNPPLPQEVSCHLTQSRRPDTQRGCGIHHFGVRMTTQKENHAHLERRHADRLQTFSELAVQLQHQFQECQLFMTVVLDTLYGPCVVPRCAIESNRLRFVQS